ncbi:EAL domain-containing protein [Massilia sp. PAMC28688]|uniref:sensor domain-containing protein n=1 Tax=Massilia sp. PAMC28688 TaxID=2861283 RepID=UPI001C62E3F2|nr:EAL domain-containing protein [Massilia sp. PAMC28688]QYF95819.1 EAL domain-containing protein [Massilia sp. PAMC28688]
MAEPNDTSFNELFRAHPIPMWVYDLETLAFKAVNTAAIMHYGYSEQEFLTLTLVDLRPPTELPKLYANLRNATNETLERSGTWRHRKKDGTLIDVEISSHPLNFHGRACKFVLAHDVTDRVQAERKIARLNRVYALLSGINSAIVRIRDRDALFKEACRLATMEGGFVSASIDTAGSHDGPMTNEAGAGRVLQTFASAPEGPWIAARAAMSSQAVICNDIAADPAMQAYLPVLVPRGVRAVASFPILVGERVASVFTLMSDVADVFDPDELKVLTEMAGDLSFALLFLDREEQLSYMAYYDLMTALPNRRLFLDRLAQLLQPGSDTIIGVVLINLDRFAQLNDAMGRHAGDALLVHIARRLGQRLPDTFNLARIGGDTFALTLCDLTRGEDAGDILQQSIFTALDQPFSIDEQEVRVSTRAGLALSPADGTDAETLFKHAEAALKNAKASGERYLYYAPRMNAALAARLALENELQTALEEDQFVMFYQPRVDLFTGRIVSAEALIRWNHPLRGLVGPVDFIPLAEETGLIRPIGTWVIEAVCRQQKAWMDGGLPLVPVAINLSAVQCMQVELLAIIAAATERFRLDQKYIEFELTETAVMMNPDDAARNLIALKAMGVQLSLDDFGTGYSSLAQLKRFPFDFVKIDRSFIAGVDANPEDQAIAAAIIAMAHSLGLKVVAEGVETQAQLSMLRTLRCDEMQGYFFSKPVPAADFEALVRSNKRL